MHADRISIGGMMLEERKCFKTQQFSFFPGQRLYLCSDGYYSQFGGEKNKKFMKSRFVSTLTELQPFPFNRQKTMLLNTFSEWKGENQQVDDVLIVGIEL